MEKAPWLGRTTTTTTTTGAGALPVFTVRVRAEQHGGRRNGRACAPSIKRRAISWGHDP